GPRARSWALALWRVGDWNSSVTDASVGGSRSTASLWSVAGGGGELTPLPVDTRRLPSVSTGGGAVAQTAPARFPPPAAAASNVPTIPLPSAPAATTNPR